MVSSVLFAAMVSVAMAAGTCPAPAPTPAAACSKAAKMCSAFTGCAAGQHASATKVQTKTVTADIKAECCVTDMCSGNNPASHDVTCNAGHHYKATSTATVKTTGIDQAALNTLCCDKTTPITNKCFGNTDTTKDANCASQTKTLKANHAAVDATGKTGAALITACCDDIAGKCSGNTVSTGNHACASGYKLKMNPNTINKPAANPETACCDQTCSSWATTGCKKADGFVADATKAGDAGSTIGQCCKQIQCCGNADGTNDANCPAGKHLKKTANLLMRGAAAGAEAACCDVDTCSEKVTCGTGKKMKGVGQPTGLDVSKDKCCEDSCEGFSGCESPKVALSVKVAALTARLAATEKTSCCETLTCEDYKCQNGKQLVAAKFLDAQGDGSTCCEKIVDRCTGNFDSTQDITCDSKYWNKGVSVTAVGADAAAKKVFCCSKYTMRCTGNFESAENVQCGECKSGKATCTNHAEKYTVKHGYTAASNMCSNCCDAPAPAGSANTSSKNAVLSSAFLFAFFAFIGF